uniref:Coiled-coil domain-containing protein 181 n=1 Tax=Trichobilharzia regenti TaxID=157069 RepID=A0AA85JHZ5_TRIRE|nr:unnamed protein product [Trichobilharzia regenti]
MPTELFEKNHGHPYESNTKCNNSIKTTCCDADDKEKNTTQDSYTTVNENNTGSKKSEINPLTSDFRIQNSSKSPELTSGQKQPHLSCEYGYSSSNISDDEIDDSDGSSEYIRKRVAELNAELLKEKQSSVEDYQKRKPRVNFHSQLVYSRTISENSYEDLCNSDRDEKYHLAQKEQNNDDTTDHKPNISMRSRDFGVIESATSKQEGISNVEKTNGPLNDNICVFAPKGDVTKTQKSQKPSSRTDNRRTIKKSNNIRTDQKNATPYNSSSLNNKVSSCGLNDKDRENAIKAWHQAKNREYMKRKIEESEKRKREEEYARKKEIENQKIREKKFTEWLRNKSLQKRYEEEMRRRENEERNCLTVVHSRKACEKAFKQWLRRKNREAEEEVKRANERMKITRKLMRNHYNSQKLLQSIQKAGLFEILC